MAKRKVEANPVDITVVLDRSGSMGMVLEDTIGGFNQFLAEQRKCDGKAYMSLVQFDNEYEPLYAERDIKKAEDLTTETFVPRGWTALHDAIGKTIAATAERLSRKRKKRDVIFVILTDGYENASTEYSSQAIKELIQQKQENDKWEFLFLGANQDAIHIANSVGIGAQNSFTYMQCSGGTQGAFNMAANSISSYRIAGGTIGCACLSINDDQRASYDKEFKSRGRTNNNS